VVELLSKMSYRQRVEQLGLREDRADVILPAGMIYERVATVARADELLVPAVGLKDGVLIDLAEDLASHEAHEDRKDRQAVAGSLALGRRYLFDEAHALQVSRLAASLFDQLQKVHGMGAAERRMLLAAAVLHDIGAFVGYKKHHKHSLYLIANSEVPELTQRETEIVANLARYHRKGVPAEHHEAFTALPDGRPGPRGEARVDPAHRRRAGPRAPAGRARGDGEGHPRRQAEAGPRRRRRPAAGALGAAPQGRPLRRHLRPRPEIT
jgi:exopolyphosphatase/guanosine-5'-triphosphate,3'-diphosphate pyrophosphatase